MKLHELLAVENSLENQAAKVRTDLVTTFTSKRHLFEEKRTTFTSNVENSQPQTEEQKDIQSTVVKELAWISPIIAKSLDASYQVAEANTAARADVILEDSTVLLAGVPATALLELEKRLTEIAQLVHAIPTLDPAKGFKLDGNREGGIYAAREVIKTRTKKAKKLYVKYAPTPDLPNLPAQTELIDEDLPVGTLREQEWSGLTTPAEKADMIARCETLIRAVKQARSRANNSDVDPSKKIGAKLLGYITATK